MSEYPVIDATRKRVGIIQECDRDALRCHPSLCVVANMLMRIFKAQDVKVGAWSVRILIDGHWHRYELSKNTRAMIRAYDAEGQAMPAGIKIELLPPTQPYGVKTGKQQGVKRGRGTNPDHISSRRPSLRNIFVEPPG
jgi:hypothetical protein